MLVEVLILTIVCLYLVYRRSSSNHDYFKIRGIPYDKPKPILGTLFQLVFSGKSIFDIMLNRYNKYNGKIYGVFDQNKPAYFIRDPELIKQITIKDFDHFANHRSMFCENDQNLFAASLLFMKDSRWKDMRNILTPAFTGSKLRGMFQLMNEVALNALMHLGKQPEANTSQGLEMDIKDFITRYTNDIVASTAFGLSVNSFADKDNEFYRMGKMVTSFSLKSVFKLIMFVKFKRLFKWLDMDLFDKKSTKYFMSLVLDTMKYRQEHNINRPDMVQMLMEAQELSKQPNGNRTWSDVDIVGQCFFFFFAGFDTSAGLSCFTIHELMENPEVQEKLLQEIQEVDSELKGEPLTYESLMGMRYLEMVVRECLRKWPATVVVDRQCNKDISYDLGDGLRMDLQPGDTVLLPIVGFHRDPQYFENPLKFDPERFSEENKASINPFAYMPFGMGPRNCIGSRFALLETKVLIYYLLRHYKFEPAAKSCIPMELKASGLQLTAKNGFWIKFVARS
uniref:Cytochrome P450 n=1 Tax=Stomoxys calcitrans TaxID=35570 RepID=A0A1I8NRE3_STOCA